MRTGDECGCATRGLAQHVLQADGWLSITRRLGEADAF